MSQQKHAHLIIFYVHFFVISIQFLRLLQPRLLSNDYASALIIFSNWLTYKLLITSTTYLHEEIFNFSNASLDKEITLAIL